MIRLDPRVLTLALLAACSVHAPDVEPGPPALLGRLDARAAEELERCVRHEAETKDLGAISIAIVEGDTVTWAMGHGWIDPARAPEEGHATVDDVEGWARVDTLYRVGSVTKLFTDIALMQLVEAGRVDLDAPVRDYLPDFLPESEFDGEITLRQLASHRSGLVREPPVGSYFDPSEPSLGKTVKSLNRTRLVAAPGSVTKYSNAGLAVLGRVVESVSGRPFAQVLREEVLEPLGMRDARLKFEPWMAKRLARGRMWTYDGRVFPAPDFELGMAPAGNLYASMPDLLRLVSVATGAVRPVTPVLSRESWDAMMQPTLDAHGQPTSYGIGFAIGELDGHRRMGHGGAVYGHSTELAFLPDERLGVAVACATDVANTVTRRLADHALRVVLALRAGRPVPRLDLSDEVPAELARRLAGHYRAEGGETAEIDLSGDAPVLEWRGLRRRVRALGDGLIVDDRHAYGTRLVPLPGVGLEIDGVRFLRESPERPPACPPELAVYVGEYGFDHDVLYVRERAGALEALIEWFWFDALTPADPDRFDLPRAAGLYPLEQLAFERDGQGRITGARLGGVLFERRPDAGAETFRIQPTRPIDELRAQAREAQAPTGIPADGRSTPSDLVDLQHVVPDLVLDVRYANGNNFLGTPVYAAARAFLQRPAAEALRRAQERLKARGFGLLVHDAYRPWSVTRLFWDATPEAMRDFVADPSQGSRHNRGCAVDVSLVDLRSGEPVRMPSGYDEFTPRAYPAYPGGTAQERWLRGVLRDALEAEGFRVYPLEWWHFDFQGWERYAIQNESFESLSR